jgi:FixJ family two-component response regulator
MTIPVCAVFIVDDDRSVCEAIADLLASRGIETFAFNSIADYVAFDRPDVPGCLVLDVELPDINGLDFQTRMAADDHPPIVFVTGYGDVPSSVRAMTHGAVDFLVKPFLEYELVNAVRVAVERDRAERRQKAELLVLQQRLSSLTPREREVLPLVASGLLNKQAAAELGVSEVTLQIHRAKIMRKMEVASLADLVRVTEKLRIPVMFSRRPEMVSK